MASEFTSPILPTLALCALGVFVFRGARWTRPAGYALAVLMIANGLGHTLATVFGRTVESVRFPRPMPGFYSSPRLLAASVYLLWRLGRRPTPSPAPAPNPR